MLLCGFLRFAAAGHRVSKSFGVDLAERFAFLLCIPFHPQLLSSWSSWLIATEIVHRLVCNEQHAGRGGSDGT